MASASFVLYLLHPGQLLSWREEDSLPTEDHIYLGILRGATQGVELLYAQPLEPEGYWHDQLVYAAPGECRKYDTVLVKVGELLLPPAAPCPTFLLHVDI